MIFIYKSYNKLTLTSFGSRLNLIVGFSGQFSHRACWIYGIWCPMQLRLLARNPSTYPFCSYGIRSVDCRVSVALIVRILLFP